MIGKGVKVNVSDNKIGGQSFSIFAFLTFYSVNNLFSYVIIFCYLFYTFSARILLF